MTYLEQMPNTDTGSHELFSAGFAPLLTGSLFRVLGGRIALSRIS
jgi:hypothetical protein